jgi:nucleoside-diphosphate-sugar epimerase
MTRAGAARAGLTAPRSEEELEERLSRPTAEVCEALVRAPGDVVVLGAGGKMGPSLCGMARRALDELGDARRVVAVSRFSSPTARALLTAARVEVMPADLADPEAFVSLPDAANVVFMAGQKFGTRDAPSRTWHTNVVVPALAAERYRGSRIVAFSTGNVYGLSPMRSRGSREEDRLEPIGDYAASCVGRERVLEHASIARGTRTALVRLNYAVDLRYGVLVDIASRIMAGTPIDLAMGAFNCIWQGDASTMALCALPEASSPPFVVNVTGPEVLQVRDVALELGRLLGREPILAGAERPDALLSDARRALALFGSPAVNAATLTAWVAEWLLGGQRTLGRPTKYEEREGRF